MFPLQNLARKELITLDIVIYIPTSTLLHFIMTFCFLNSAMGERAQWTIHHI